MDRRTVLPWSVSSAPWLFRELSALFASPTPIGQFVSFPLGKSPHRRYSVAAFGQKERTLERYSNETIIRTFRNHHLISAF